MKLTQVLHIKVKKNISHNIPVVKLIDLQDIIHLRLGHLSKLFHAKHSLPPLIIILSSNTNIRLISHRKMFVVNLIKLELVCQLGLIILSLKK